jgi:uncharacterized protein involved in outer membrane biogenesis
MGLNLKGMRWPWIVGGAVLAVVVVIGLCEAAGWPFLVAPAQRWLGSALERRVVFGAEGDADVRIGLIGSVRVSAGRIEIGAPAWSKTPHMLLAEKARLKLGYGDLIKAYRGGILHVRELRAETFDLQLEREADGRATWQFGKRKPEDEGQAVRIPSFGELRVVDGTMLFKDAVLDADLDAKFSLTEQDTAGSAAGGASAASAPSLPASRGAEAPLAKPASRPSGLQFNANGSYRKLPLRIEFVTSSLTALAGSDGTEAGQPVRLDATIGRATLTFRGAAADPLHLTGLRGGFSVEGPSLAAIGDPLGVTLPTTGPFKTDGYLTKEGNLWKAVFNRATIGQSRLAGAFTFDRRRTVPLLAGRLTGSRLLLKDLGPVVGAAPRGAAAERAAAAASAAAAAKSAGGRVLPDRRFDLPSLRAMEANVLIDIAHLDLGTTLLEPLEPLRTHLRLAGGVLTLSEIEARTAQGRLTGALSLDGRKPLALWKADLDLLGVRLERWLRQGRDGDAPPYVSGMLDGQIKVAGSGRSTAEILGSLDGGMRFHLRNGSLSHLALEAAGIDIAQALGMVVKGDEALKIQCNIADLVVTRGVAKPRVFVIDTSDSTVWIDGTVSLQNEAMDLRAVVSPKDFSPLTVRTPVYVKGTFSNPAISVELGKIGAKVGAAALLSLLNPLAAVIPFVDPGANDEAKRAASQCAELAARGNVAKVSSGEKQPPKRRP